MSDTFDGIEKAEVFESSPKMNGGYVYDLEVVRVTERKSGGGKGMIVPVEFTILWTDDPAYKPGSLVSWVPKQSHGHAFLSNLKAFALAALGLEVNKTNIAEIDSIDPKDPQRRSHIKQILQKAISEENGLGGARLRCITQNTTTKETQRSFVSHRFLPLPTDSEE